MSDLDTILDAVISRVEGLSLTLNSEAIPVAKTKASAHRPDIDPDVRICVSKSEKPESYRRRTFKSKDVTYYVDVCLISPSSGPQANLPEYAQIRQTIMDAFDKPPLTGASDVYELDATAREYFDRQAQEALYDSQTVEVAATVRRSL